MMHYWTLLKHNEKRGKRNIDCHPNKMRSSNSSSPETETDPLYKEDKDHSSRNPSPSSATATKIRPLGRKQAKDKEKNEGDGSLVLSVVRKMMQRRWGLRGSKGYPWGIALLNAHCD